MFKVDNSKHFFFKPGEHDRDRRTNHEVYRTSRTYILHPDYFIRRSKLIYDFALVKIDPVSFTDTISPICLPSPTQTTGFHTFK